MRYLPTRPRRDELDVGPTHFEKLESEMAAVKEQLQALVAKSE
jgi:hypothetical protein